MEIYTHNYNDLRVATGDVLCTQDGDEDSTFGRIWRLMGLLVPRTLGEGVPPMLARVLRQEGAPGL